MKPFDLTQAAYALATVLPELQISDARVQKLVYVLGPDAVEAARIASRFHDAVLNISAVGDFIERLAQHEEAVFTLLAALERGEHVRLICTPVSSTSEPAVVVPLASEAA